MTRRSRIECIGRWRARTLPVVVLIALAACASHPKPTPVARPTAKPSHSIPAPRVRTPAPAPAPVPAPTVAVLDQHNYEQDKNRIKQALASDSRDALEPADVGYYMDVLQGRLKQVASKGISIVRQHDRIAINLSGRIAFESGSAGVNAGSHDILAALSRVLLEYRMTVVSVRVRADDAGAHPTNPALSVQRALAIAHYLAEAGVPIKRIVAVGAGPENRVRVELLLEPIVRAAASAH